MWNIDGRVSPGPANAVERPEAGHRRLAPCAVEGAADGPGRRGAIS